MLSEVDHFYESDSLLNQYLLFHYSSYSDYFPHHLDMRPAFDFPLRCVEEGPDYHLLTGNVRALDVGCSVGRSSFELTRYFQSVVGIDYSRAFINAAQALRKKGEHIVATLEEGSQISEGKIVLDSELNRERVHFECGDAQALRQDLGAFDLVMACNLICRLPQPMQFLSRLGGLVKPKGQLFITTPFTWLEQYTPKENWLDQKSGDSFHGLSEALKGHFKLLKHWDMPFLIRDHRRKFQLTVAQASRWERLES